MSAPSIGILHYSAPPVVGGVEAVMQAHTEVFAQQGHAVRLIAGRGNGDKYPNRAEFCLIPEIDSQHAQVIEISAALESGAVPADFYALRDQLEETLAPLVEGLDSLIVHNVFTKHFNLPLTAALSRLLDQKRIQGCIAWCHDFTWTSPSSRSKVHDGYPWDLLRTRREDVRYVVVSQERQASLAGLFNCAADEIGVVYNGVDVKVLLGLTEEGMALIQRLGLLQSDLIILMPIRVTRAKNIEFALEVVASLKRMGSLPRLVLTGPPDPHDSDNMTYYQGLKAMRGELGIEDEMIFVYESGPEMEEGFTLDLSVVGDLYRISDLLLMPSHREGFGMPVLEAGLAGIPVFATEIPAAVEIGGEDVEVIEKSQSPEEVAEQILARTADRPVHRLRKRVRHSFTWEAIYRQNIQPLLGKRDP